eukprot:3934181-Rhodomonas_salina.1
MVGRATLPLIPIAMLVLIMSFVPRWRGCLLWTPILGVLFVTFPSVTVISLQTFVCQNVDGENYLKADFRHACPESSGSWMYTFALVAAVVFGAG